MRIGLYLTSQRDGLIDLLIELARYTVPPVNPR